MVSEKNVPFRNIAKLWGNRFIDEGRKEYRKQGPEDRRELGENNNTRLLFKTRKRKGDKP